ncbi:hypothetical protein [Candidatus Odyssella thessalonicensis]|uniref:hypothetical protein n=1 Tax=Candidatus Odyssella thessalonicensis TaxID=84647 RepID=UPI000225B6EE|nr:hypothetical protein [Candidatus Odyssella thessalonicensis]
MRFCFLSFLPFLLVGNRSVGLEEHVNAYNADMLEGKLSTIISYKPVDFASPYELIARLKNAYTRHNNLRSTLANEIQEEFLIQIRETEVHSAAAIELIGILIEQSIYKLNISLRRIERISHELDDTVLPPSIKIPKCDIYPLETTIPPSFHKFLLSYYLQGIYGPNSSKLMQEMELVLGTKYISCINDFKEITTQDANFIEFTRSYIHYNNALPQTPAFAKGPPLLQKLRNKFFNVYGLEYTEMLTLYRNRDIEQEIA